MASPLRHSQRTKPFAAVLTVLLTIMTAETASSWLPLSLQLRRLPLSHRIRGNDGYFFLHHRRRMNAALFSTKQPVPPSNNTSQVEDEATATASNDGDWWSVDDLEVLQGQGDDFFDDEDDEAAWIPDGEMARRKRSRQAHHPTPAAAAIQDIAEQSTNQQQEEDLPSPYTEEEIELIEAMGGKDMPKKVTVSGGSSSQHDAASKREDGFLGDSTLEEIATDYSVPVSYLADVLCMWGVPVPINLQDRLGDLVTGEQAFALVEAVYSLDVADLQDRYSNLNLMQLCEEYEIPFKDAFEFAMKNGWSLPFGVNTNLRVEQEEELIRVLSVY